MYHRILPLEDQRFRLEEPGMVVHPDTFRMQLKELKRHFDVVSLSGWLDALEREEPLPKRACAITFDDGWMDNYQYALPILKEQRVPATLFAVAEKIGTDFQFWPNIVAALLVQGGWPLLAGHPALAPAIAGLDMPQGEATPDQVAKCIGTLKQLPDAVLYQALDSLDWRTLCRGLLEPALMDWKQLISMQDSGWVSIGSHTCSHKRLTSDLTAQELESEIVESKRILQAKTGNSIELFCFPNGDYNQQALDLVRYHYRAAVTTHRGINLGESVNRHELTRIGIHDDIAYNPRLFSARLSGWV